MEQDETEKIIKEIIREIVSRMGFEAEIEIKKDEAGEGALVYNIKTEDSAFLIGQYGINLQSLQHLVRLLVKNKTEEKVNFVVDVNMYRQEKNESIGKMAREMAEQAVREGRAVVLRPMSAYERRLVHLELSENTQIKTESVGEGEDRKVVIKPADSI